MKNENELENIVIDTIDEIEYVNNNLTDENEENPFGIIDESESDENVTD